MEGGFGFPFGGDPEEMMRNLREFLEAQGEQAQEVQSKHFAGETLDTAVELTSAALGQIQPQGTVDEQAIALRDAMRVLFPEAVALVSAARQGLMRDS
jgi:ferredoxin-NADP reductase